jgi:hypothetical protein
VKQLKLNVSSLYGEWKSTMCVPIPTPTPPATPPIKQSPWVFQTRILFATLQRCACGASYPAFQARLGAQFIHARTKMVWIVAGHPSIYNNSYPIKAHWREERIYWCVKCLPAPPINRPTQLSFSFDFC